MKCYNLDGIITELQKSIATKKALLESWEAVTFPAKKNGEPFATMSKNISGAKYSADNVAMQPGEMVLTVTAWEKEMGCGYVADEVKAYNLVKYMTDGKPEAKPQNIQPKITMLEQVYTYDLEDIKEAVAARIEELKEAIANRERQLEAAPAAYKAYKTAYAAALAELENTADKAAGSELYMMIRDTVQARYPYC